MFQVIPLGADTVKLRWSDPTHIAESAEIDGFEWEAHAITRQGLDHHAGTTSNDQHEMIIGNLKPAQSYQFKVRNIWVGFEEVCYSLGK